MQTITTYYSNYDGLKRFVSEHRNVLFSEANSSVLVQVFCGICDEEYLKTLLNNINRLVPHASVIGATTSGEIMNGTVSALKAVLSFSVFKCTDIRVDYARQDGSSSYKMGQKIASRLTSNKTKLLILFSSGKAVNANQMLMGVQSVSPGVSIAGGVAGDNFINNQNFVLCNNKIIKCGVAGIVLEGENLSINQHCHLGWQPIGKEMTITRSEGFRVYTIDNIPACQIYRKYLGVYDKDNIINSIFPLITKRRGIDIVTTPCMLHDDDSIDFYTEMSEGEKVRLSYGHVDMILQSMDKLLYDIKQQPVESIFVYSCSMRRGFLQDSSEIETLPLQKIATTTGFFTSGEFFHINNTNQLLNSTMTTLALSESNEKEQVLPPELCNSLNHENIISDVSNSKDNIIYKNITILKALTNLVNSVTNELSERTAELEKVNEEVKFASIHDPLTGLYNRSYYEEEMKRLESPGNHSAAIIMCDVDGLKLINDTMGHATGDAILKAVADILMFFLNKGICAARIGGDEFSIILPNCTQSTIKNYCQHIYKAVDQYNKINPALPLSLSIGFSYCKKDFKDVDTLFKEADNNMYREKLHRSKSIRSDLVQTLLSALEARDILTEKHGNRLQDMIEAFADYIGYSKNNCADLQLFARFHDIGKVGIPDSILLKPGKLLQNEKKEMQRHCEIGYRIAQSSTDLLPIADWILKHHEWWNGRGYPLELTGEAIPVECRILAIIDAYDAMTNNRPYRKAMDNEAAITELKHYAGTQFDPELVEKFIAMLESKKEALE